jgi:hypothetical protein
MFIGVSILITVFIPKIYFSKSLVLKSREQNDIGFEADDISIFNNQNANMNEGPSQSQKFLKNLKILFTNKIFLLCSITLANLFFILTVVQYWAADYIKAVLGKSEEEATMSFVIVCITSPTLGVLVGGFVSQKLGGYENNRTIYLVWILALLAGVSSFPIYWADNLIFFTAILWVVLFFGGAMLPPITGLIISSLPMESRGSANSINFFTSNLLGYLPAPFIYGLLKDVFEEVNPKIAFTSCMYYSFVGFFILTIAVIYKKIITKSENSILEDKLSFRNEEELKSSFRKSRASLEIGTNIAKVFGNFPNVDVEGAQNLNKSLIDENKTNSMKKSFNENKSVSVLDKSNNDDKYDSSPDHSDDEVYADFNKRKYKNIENHQPQHPHSIHTPYFNILHTNTNDYEQRKKTNTTYQQEDSHFREESIFGFRVGHNTNSNSEINENEIALKHTVSQSLNEKEQQLLKINEAEKEDDNKSV